jgi:hypothetical protein
MPVTSRKLLVAKISGAGKKAPANLRFNPLIGRVVNIRCFSKTSSNPQLIIYNGGGAFSNFTNIINGGNATTTTTTQSCP